MRVNAKTAKELRKAAGYVNQSSTPGTMPFPGIARMYSHPVYQTRDSFHTTYEKRGGRWVRVYHKRKAMAVIGRVGQQEIVLPALEEKVYPKNGATYYGPVTELVPVSKPARLKNCAKAVYRDLKRMLRQGILSDPHAFDTFVDPAGGAA